MKYTVNIGLTQYGQMIEHPNQFRDTMKLVITEPIIIVEHLNVVTSEFDNNPERTVVCTFISRYKKQYILNVVKEWCKLLNQDSIALFDHSTNTGQIIGNNETNIQFNINLFKIN